MRDPISTKLNALTRAHDNGLHAIRDGLNEWAFETTSTFMNSVARHSQVVENFERVGCTLPAGVRIVVSLVTNGECLTQSDLRAATSISAKLYQDGDTLYLEWQRGGGWRDRRVLSAATCDAIKSHLGCVLTHADWAQAKKWLQEVRRDQAIAAVLDGFIADAQSWWFRRLSGPMFVHMTGLRPLQPLPRAALARRATKLPQISSQTSDDVADIDRVRYMLQATRARTNHLSTINALKGELGQIVRRRGSKDVGLEKIATFIDGLMTRAVLEGRAQLLILAATRHVIKAGGIRGKPLAPATLHDYLRDSLSGLVIELAQRDIDSLTAQDWYLLYRRVVASAKESQHKKLAAFLEVFHRFMVITGAEPLQHSLTGKRSSSPPSATVIWPHELELAVEYVWGSQCSDRVKMQAELGLRLGFRVPIRISEFWSIRMTDLYVDRIVTLTIYPRQRDGRSKSPALRRQVDLDDEDLVRVLLDIYQKRKQEHADGEDVLCGEPGVPDARYEEESTTSLMNESLRWVTGDQASSFHDLRHTSISRVSEPVLAGRSIETDAGLMQCISASSGHAGPASSGSYQHWIEEPIVEQVRAARPSAWQRQDMDCGVEFSDISLGQVEEARAPTKTRQTDLPNESKNLLLDERARLLQYVSDGYALDAVAAMCKVRLPVVHDAISEMSRAIAWAALAEHTQISNTRIQCRLVSAFSLWSRAALQKKHLGIRQMLASDLAAGKWRELEWLWNAWLQCNEHGDLSLVNSQAAITFVKAVLRAGVPRRALLIVSQVGSVPLAPDISRLGLDVRTVKKREGRAAHRLQMSDPATAASSTSGAALSVLGLHWWMLCLGSVLLSRDGV